MATVQVSGLVQSNTARWPQMVIDFDALATMNQVAARLIAAKARYQSLYAQTRVPWPVIALIHQRECSQNWALSIAQGDPWNQVSVHVPSGRGPFGSWEEAAIDALTNCEHMDQWAQWDSTGGVLTRLEMYNGLGYANRNPSLPSPYIWSRTSPYVSGKYVADGKFDPNTIDSQQGCAPLLASMMEQDPTIATDYAWPAPPAQPSLIGADGVPRDTRWLQSSLNQLGANPQLSVDGQWGNMTMTAVRGYQQGAGLFASGRYNVPTLQSLENALSGPAATNQA
ncbi:MAG TPA: peptidoglycan-binding protein [Terracidiphilus sp.]|jgi:lysozyme family protein|nr:peptidoglycan-binding protein [Terracidiphilus sp.]